MNDDDLQPPPTGFWGRATVALALVLYAWSMMGVTLYLRYAEPAEGPSKALAVFRRMVMGRGVTLLGAVAVLAGIILAIAAKRRRPIAWLALGLAAGWLALVLVLWPL